MSDAEDTETVPTTPEITTETVPTDDVVRPDDVSMDEPPAEIADPSTGQIESPPNTLNVNEVVGNPKDSKKDGEGSEEDKKEGQESKKTGTKKIQSGQPLQSRCRARSRDMRQCKKPFREMIGKHEIRNNELEQRETDLRQRLEMLECSTPAVMVWNIWRMAQGAPVSRLRDIVEKQFLDPASGFAACPSTPSQHWDCRVREVEAERKQALQRVEEARKVFAVKEDALRSQKQQIEEARKLQEERKMQITELEDEVKRLQDALKKAQGDENSCETGECGEIQCREMWLQGVSSVNSIHSTDLECLARLQDLAEAELCMKQQIADLERRECAYMRTLQQADEMWAKMEDDNASNLGDLKEQLDAKIAANQQLADRIVELEDEIEKLRGHLTKALAALNEYDGKTFADTGFGDTDISTKEETEQTDDGKEKIQVPQESEVKDPTIKEEPMLPETEDLKTEGIEQLQEDTDMIDIPIEDHGQTPQQKIGHKTPMPEATKGDTQDPGVEVALANHKEIQFTTKTDTTDESVEAKPVFKETETQSMKMEPGLEKETATENRTQVETATITEVIGGDTTTMPYPIGQQQEITVARKASKTEFNHVDKPATAADAPSLAQFHKAPTEDGSTGISEAPRNEDNSSGQKKTFQMPPEVTAEAAPISATEYFGKNVSDKTVKTTLEPVGETLKKPSPGPLVDTSSEPATPATPVRVTKLLAEGIPRVASEANSIVPPVSTIEDIPRPVFEPPSELATDTAPISSTVTAVPAVQRPIPGPTGVTGQWANTFELPIQTLLSWHNITACLRKQILVMTMLY